MSQGLRKPVKLFPAPAIGTPAINELKYNDGNSSSTKDYDVPDNDHDGPRSVPSRPGTLPDCASELSNAARSLLNRLLDPDPKVRMKNIRQLQQTAFYMGFNFEHVKAKKVSPKPIFERHFPDHQEITQHNVNEQEFAAFDHSIFPL